MEITPAHTLNFTGVLFESKRIVRANSTHFLALSLLFLPFTYSLIINPTLSLSGHFTVDHHHRFPPNHQKAALYHLLYILTVYALALCATATITYSTHHGFFGKPVKLIASLKSLIFTFFPLVSTAIVAHVLVILISLAYVMFVGTILTLVRNLGFVIDFNSILFMWFSAFVGAILVAILVYFHVNWSLAFVIVVAESKWGFAPLMRSSYLIKGMRSVSLSLFFFYGILVGLLVMLYSQTFMHYGFSSWGMFYALLSSSFLMMFLLQGTSANTVLYNYCKAFHGELAIDIDQGFAHDYIDLPCNDDNEKLTA